MEVAAGFSVCFNAPCVNVLMGTDFHYILKKGFLVIALMKLA